MTIYARHRRHPRDLSLPFNWRLELCGLAVSLAWIVGMMAVWWLAIHVFPPD